MSRLFKSISRKPPTPEQISSRKYPQVCLWNAKEGVLGKAVMEISWDEGKPEIVYQMIRGCGHSFPTHWRWTPIEELEAL